MFSPIKNIFLGLSLVCMSVLVPDWSFAQGKVATEELTVTVRAKDFRSLAEFYARRSGFADAVVSPDGSKLALLMRSDSQDSPRALMVMDLPPVAPPRVLVSFSDGDVSSVTWINKDRLLYELESFNQESPELGGTFAIDSDGKRNVELIARLRSTAHGGSRVLNRTLTGDWAAIGPVGAGTGSEILVQQFLPRASGEWSGGQVARLDSLTQKLTPLSIPAGSHSWVFDSNGEPRIARMTQKGRDILLGRSKSSDSWDVLSDVASFDAFALEPLFLEGEHSLIVVTRAGRDTAGLWIFDLNTKKLSSEPLAHVGRYDITRITASAKDRKVVAARFVSDRPQTIWFDPKLATLQKSIDASLPKDRTNHISCSQCLDQRYFIVRSFSDRHPGEYFLYDSSSSKLMKLGEARPWVKPSTQGARTFHWISARDGLQLPVVITHPPASSQSKALPTILLVHGGPWVRGVSLVWSPEAQFLASLGYRVIEPDFRGSLGYGHKHFEAGLKQWGLAMQDDLADSIQWAVSQRLTDPQNVCVYGASYGGYAALMAPVRNPSMFKCAASLVGVTDIMLMFRASLSDVTDDIRLYGLPRLIGDPASERDLLQRNSPINRVAEIKVPVLLGQGLEDRRVPREHADAFYSAAKSAGVNVERVNYADEGHGFQKLTNQVDFWRRLGVFLEKSLAQ